MFLIFRLFSLYKQPYSESTLMKAKIMDFLNYFLSNKKWQKYENNGKNVKKNYQFYQFVVNKSHFLYLWVILCHFNSETFWHFFFLKQHLSPLKTIKLTICIPLANIWKSPMYWNDNLDTFSDQIQMSKYRQKGLLRGQSDHP